MATTFLILWPPHSCPERGIVRASKCADASFPYPITVRHRALLELRQFSLHITQTTKAQQPTTTILLPSLSISFFFLVRFLGALFSFVHQDQTAAIVVAAFACIAIVLVASDKLTINANTKTSAKRKKKSSAKGTVSKLNSTLWSFHSFHPLRVSLLSLLSLPLSYLTLPHSSSLFLVLESFLLVLVQLFQPLMAEEDPHAGVQKHQSLLPVQNNLLFVCLFYTGFAIGTTCT